MRVIAVIDQGEVVEKILRRLGLLGRLVGPGPRPPADQLLNPPLYFIIQPSVFSAASMPDYENVPTD